MKISITRTLAALALTGGIAGVAAAQDYPYRDITTVVVWGAGGGTDTINRMIMAEMEKHLPVSINVINQTGGVAGSNGMVYAANQPDDGYTLVGLSESNVTAAVQGGWDKKFDYWYPFIVGGSPDLISVPADSPHDSLSDLIEAAMAFGTGHHGTTLGCLRALDRLANEGFEGQSVADIGCGTAVLAMAAARIWPQEVLASDIDRVAVDVAEANVRANGLEGRVACVEATGFDHPDIAARAPFDLVFANILMGPLIALAPDMARALDTGGYAILSGILTEQADEVIAVYSRNGINLVQREDIVEWTTLTLRKSS